MQGDRTHSYITAIALFLRFSVRRSPYSWTTGDRIIFEIFWKAIALTLP
ncbi:hypothetical protein [Nostoc sp.]